MSDIIQVTLAGNNNTIYPKERKSERNNKTKGITETERES